MRCQRLCHNLQQSVLLKTVLFDTYDPEQFYDEYFSAPGCPRPDVESIVRWLQQLSAADLAQANAKAEEVLAQLGATFTFDGEPRVLPFDVIPRVISATEWQRLSAGLKQRVAALNLFCADVYGKQQIINDGKIPREVVESAERFLPDCMGMQPRNGVWCHVSGIDLICDRNARRRGEGGRRDGVESPRDRESSISVGETSEASGGYESELGSRLLVSSSGAMAKSELRYVSERQPGLESKLPVCR